MLLFDPQWHEFMSYIGTLGLPFSHRRRYHTISITIATTIISMQHASSTCIKTFWQCHRHIVTISRFVNITTLQYNVWFIIIPNDSREPYIRELKVQKELNLINSCSRHALAPRTPSRYAQRHYAVGIVLNCFPLLIFLFQRCVSFCFCLQIFMCMPINLDATH